MKPLVKTVKITAVECHQGGKFELHEILIPNKNDGSVADIQMLDERTVVVRCDGSGLVKSRDGLEDEFQLSPDRTMVVRVDRVHKPGVCGAEFTYRER